VAQFVKFEVSKEIEEMQLLVLEKATRTGKIKVGSNEVTKAIERGNAKLVLIAKDVNPPEIVMHLPVLCNEKSTAFSYVSTKKELGKNAGLPIGTSSLAIVIEGDAKKDLDELTKKLCHPFLQKFFQFPFQWDYHKMNNYSL